MVLRDDALRKFEGWFVAVLEPPANACIVGVDGAAVLAAECGIAVFRPKVELHFRILFLFHLFAQSAYLLIQLGNGSLLAFEVVDVERLPRSCTEIAVDTQYQFFVRRNQRMQSLDVRAMRQLV